MSTPAICGASQWGHPPKKVLRAGRSFIFRALLRDLLRRLLAAGNRINLRTRRALVDKQEGEDHDFGELRSSLSDADKGNWTEAPRPFIYLSCGRRPPRSNGQN